MRPVSKSEIGLIEMHIVRREDAPLIETVKGRHGIILHPEQKTMMMILTVEPEIPTPPQRLTFNWKKAT